MCRRGRDFTTHLVLKRLKGAREHVMFKPTETVELKHGGDCPFVFRRGMSFCTLIQKEEDCLSSSGGS